MTERYNIVRSLPAEWLPYADARKDAQQVNVRINNERRYNALRRLAHKLDISTALLARVIVGRVISGETVSSDQLIAERKRTPRSDDE